MAKVVDPDLLADEAAYTGTKEVFVNTASKTIRLTVVGDLSNTGVQNENGVTLKCLYSFLKEEWRTDPNTKNLAAFPFPLVPITDESFEFVDGWDFYDDTARYLIRDAGWTVKNTSGLVTQKWAGIIGLGSIETNDQLYYQQSSGGAAVNVQLTGQINQAVQILRDDDGDGDYGEGSDFDRRTVFNLFAREYAQLYGKASLSDIGVTSLDSIAYRFPISTGADLKITATDGDVGTISPYTEIKIRYFDQAYSRDVDSATNRLFGIVIDVGTHSGVDGAAPGGASVLTSAEGGMTVDAFAGGVLTIHEGTDDGVQFPIVSNTATTITVTGTIATVANGSFTAQLATPVVASAAQIYTKVQYQLRQNSDIDATDQSVTGKTADALMRFVGDNLISGSPAPTNPNGGGSGVMVEGFSASDTNDLDFYDNGAVTRAYPFVAVLNINFGANLQADADAKYWVYFTHSHTDADDTYAITSAAGQTATLTNTGPFDMSEILDNEEFLVSGFVTGANNGMYRAVGNGAAGTIDVEKADTGDSNFVNEAAGATVTLALNPFNSASALVVDDNDGNDMAGDVSAASTVAKSFNFDGNVQGGRTGGVTVSITAVAIGLTTGQYVKATGTLAASISNSISLVAPFERTYTNP